MATMRVMKEVEATPALIESQLRAFHDTLPKGDFPAKAGDMIHLTDATIAAVGGVADMPALVLASSQGVSVAVVAIYSVVGNVVSCVVNGTQVKAAS